MPFGFVGSLGALVLLAALIPLAFCYGWPGSIARPGMFLLIAIVVGVAAAVALFLWHIQALSGIALSGEKVEGAQTWTEFEANLRVRFFWIAFALAGLQAIVCFALRSLLGRGVPQ